MVAVLKWAVANGVDGRVRIAARWAMLGLQTLLAALAVFLAFIAVLTLAGPALGIDYAVVKSGSMSPTYGAGSMIFITSVDAADVKPGDVISWHRESDFKRVITHRVVQVVPSGGSVAFRTKGDANEEADSGVVTADQLKGRVVFGLPYIGRLAPILQEGRVFFALVIIPATLLVAMELFSIRTELRGKSGSGTAES